MTREISTIWLILIVVASAIICGWMVLLFDLSPMLLYDSNVAVSKTMTEQQLKHMADSSAVLLRFAIIPMTILTGMWVLAFVIERRDHNKSLLSKIAF